MNRLRRFIQLLRIARSLQRFEFQVQPTWSRETEGKALVAFLSSPAGKRFLRIIDWRRSQHICAATLEAPKGGRDYAAGYAAGFNDYFGVIHTLSARVQPQSDATTEDSLLDDGEHLEHLSP